MVWGWGRYAPLSSHPQKRPVMKDFLLTVVLEGLEEKYGVVLSRGKTNSFIQGGGAVIMASSGGEGQ